MKKGTTYQRKDGRWECRISLGSEGGKRKYKSYYGATEQEAEYKMMLDCQTIQHQAAVTEMTVKDLSAEWLYVTRNRIKESTAANYRMKLDKHILPAFGKTNAAMLAAKDIYAFIESKLKSGLSARYVTDIIVLLKSIYRYACREYAVRNVLDGIVLPKKKHTEVKVLTANQQKTLSAYLNTNRSTTTLGIALSLYTGVRIGELCALQWQDIDLVNNTLTVRKTIQRIQTFGGKRRTQLVITEPKSANSLRTIPIPECIMPMVRQFADKSGAYILSGNCKPIEPRTMQNRFKRILENANLPSVNYHALRHSFSTSALELGFDIKTLSEILGHSSVEVTLNRYIHSSMDRKRSCMNLLSLSA
ncbi:MAG: site-specific integrase [Ruminococcus sp.]|nr:site-specific integrase [Ruminococcus sp.]